MKKETLRAFGFVLIVAALAVLVVCFNDIKAVISGIMMGQADFLMDQLLR